MDLSHELKEKELSLYHGVERNDLIGKLKKDHETLQLYQAATRPVPNMQYAEPVQDVCPVAPEVTETKNKQTIVRAGRSPVTILESEAGYRKCDRMIESMKNEKEGKTDCKHEHGKKKYNSYHEHIKNQSLKQERILDKEKKYRDEQNAHPYAYHEHI